uniref:MazG domain-containing protein n=1 Tax=Panagrellus redivivus TaxID=6233 RepID=A0A7E4VBX9_PANRE
MVFLFENKQVRQNSNFSAFLNRLLKAAEHGIVAFRHGDFVDDALVEDMWERLQRVKRQAWVNEGIDSVELLPRGEEVVMELLDICFHAVDSFDAYVSVETLEDAYRGISDAGPT